MTTIDDAVRDALSPEDYRTYKALGEEPSLIAEALGAFQARHRLIGALGWIMGFGFFGFFVWFAWRFAHAEDLRTMLLWGGAAAVCLVFLAMVKLWFWFEMQSNAVMREIKRLEFQVASLAARKG